jgi:DNA-binding GntR family transcriptional regulator
VPLPNVTVLVPDRPEVPSLSERAYYLIRDLIVSLQLPPGSSIDERRLMAELGLGRTPIREAVRRLANENLVDVYPRRGMFVSAVDAGDLAGVTEVRLVLEGHAARLAAVRATPAERTQAAALIAEVDAGHAGADHARLIDLDQRIHQHVHRCTHNPFLVATLETYFVLALRIWFLVLDRVGRLDDAVREHRDLLEAVRRGDADEAERVVRHHITGFEREIRKVL